MLIRCRKNLSQRDLMDYKIIIIEEEKNIFWWRALIVANVLKVNRN
jgi:hypothetical protein